MRKNLRIIACIASAVMVMSAMAGCSTGKEPSDADQTSAKTGTSSSASEKPSEPIKLKIEIFDRAIAGLTADNNISTKYVQENFGDPNNIEVTYIPVPRSQEKDMLNTLMAANDAPDLCFTYYNDLVYNYVKNDGLHDLTQLIAEHGKELSTFLGEDVLQWGQFNEKQYAIPARRTDRGTLTTFIRKDWLDQLKLPVPTTTQEFYDCMVAFKNAGLGGADTTIPFGLNFSAVDIIWSTANIIDSFKTTMSDKDLATLSEFAMPGAKEGIRFLNKMYSEGLVSQNFALDKDTSQYKKDIVSGKMGALQNNTDFIYSAGNGLLQMELAKTVPGAEYLAIDPFKNAEGKTPKRLYTSNGISNFVPKTCKNPEAVIKYLNWMVQDDVRDFLQYGVEGVHYESKANGYPEGKKANADLPAGQILGEVLMVLNGNDFGDPEINLKALGANYPGYEQKAIDSLKLSLIDGWTRPRLEAPVESESSLGATVQDKGNELFVKAITCKPAEFDAVYDKLLKEYMEIGGQKILDEKIAIWDAQNK